MHFYLCFLSVLLQDILIGFMALKIRLSRGGSKRDPHYSIVVIESTKKREGKFVKKIGHYHPCLKNNPSSRVSMNEELLNYWLSVGARPTDVVVRLAETAGIKSLLKYKKTFKVSEHKGMSKKEIEEIKKQKNLELEEKKKQKAAQAKLDAEEAAKAASAAAESASVESIPPSVSGESVSESN